MLGIVNGMQVRSIMAKDVGMRCIESMVHTVVCKYFCISLCVGVLFFNLSRS